MAEVQQRTYYTHRGSVLYHPSDPSFDRIQPAQLPEPPFRRRQPRPSSIHITRFPAGYVFHVPPTPIRREPSRLGKSLRKLASRDAAKRVVGTVLTTINSQIQASARAVDNLRVIESLRSPSPTSARPFSSSGPALLRRLSGRASRPRPHSVVFPLTDDFVAHPREMAALASTSRMMQTLPMPSSNGRGSISGPTDHRGSIGAASLIRPSASTHGSSDSGVKPLASATGITVGIELAEPHVYLTGFDHDGRGHSGSQNTTAIIRGKLVLNVTKSIKIKAVTLSFCGKARTEWPEGIPPAKSEYYEEKKLRQQVMPFYNIDFKNDDKEPYGTRCNYTLRSGMTSESSTNLMSSATGGSGSTRSSRSGTLLSAPGQKRLSLQHNQSRSFDKSSSISSSVVAVQKGYKVFHPGTYEYSFDIPMDHTCPETIDLPLGSVKWILEALVERAGTFKPNLHGTKEVTVIRSPDQNSLEQVEPIAISRKWEDQLHYDIVISGKSFPIGSKIPIAFKLTPLAKVQCHRIKVYVTENADYFTEDKKVTRRDAQRKILLFERQAGKPLSEQYKGCDIQFTGGGETDSVTRDRARRRAQDRRERDARSRGQIAPPLPPPTENLLGDIELGLDNLAIATEIEMNVQLPTCAQMKKDRVKMIHPDTTWKLIQVHHWIKIVLRLSRLDTDDPSGTKRRHFEISIDSPFHILSCLSTAQHTALPEYSSSGAGDAHRTFECGCPNAAQVSGSASSSSGEVPTMSSFGNGTASSSASSASGGSGTNGFDHTTLAMPAPAHLSSHGSTGVQRPIHMLRAPSFNPPAFDDDEPPPPLPTPPPGYDMVIGTPSHADDHLADYFARFADQYGGDDDDDTDDEEMLRLKGRNGRVNVPMPNMNGAASGGGVARGRGPTGHGLGRQASRSMDISREFALRTPPGAARPQDGGLSGVRDVWRTSSIADVR